MVKIQLKSKLIANKFFLAGLPGAFECAIRAINSIMDTMPPEKIPIRSEGQFFA